MDSVTKMGHRNVFISVFVLFMFLQTVFNLPVDAQGLKKDHVEQVVKEHETQSRQTSQTGQTSQTRQTGQTSQTGPDGKLDVGRVVDLTDAVTDRLARFLFPGSSPGSSSGGIGDLFSMASSMTGGMNLLDLKLDQDAIVKVRSVMAHAEEIWTSFVEVMSS